MLDVRRWALNVQDEMALIDKRIIWITFAAVFLIFSDPVCSQFSPAFPQNDSYWANGKAEFNIYDAQIVRDGQVRPCEAFIIFGREFIDAKTLARVDDTKKADALSTIRMNQIFTVSRGLFVEQQSLIANWRLDLLSLAHLSVVGGDTTGNLSRRVEEKREGNSSNWFFIYNTHRDGAGFDRLVPPLTGPAIFYDELPLRVRMIDFSQAKGEFEIQLAPSLINSKKESVIFRPAKVNFTTSERKIDISVRHMGGTDQFTLDGWFPFLLREWTAADGSRWKMKRSLKVDYWNYHKPGDRERALKDPMLRHPD